MLYQLKEIDNSYCIGRFSTHKLTPTRTNPISVKLIWRKNIHLALITRLYQHDFALLNTITNTVINVTTTQPWQKHYWTHTSMFIPQSFKLHGRSCKVVSLSKKLYPYCSVLVGPRNGFERDYTIKLN